MRFLLAILSIVVAGTICAQQNPLQNLYLFDLIYVNPAFAGHDQVLATSAVLRKQWVGFEGAPESFNLAIHSPVKSKNLGLGLQTSYEHIGPRAVTNLTAVMAYRVLLNDNSRLHFGIRAGATNNQFNWNKVKYRDTQDVVQNGGSESVWLPTFDVGMLVTGNNYFAGIEVSNLSQSKLRDVEQSDAHQYIHSKIVGGYVAKLSEKVTLKPNALMRYAVNSPVQFDLNLNALFIDRIWLGAGYRFSYGLLAMLQVRVTNSFELGYAFDYALNPLKSQSSGSHEVFLSYRFNIFKNNISSPRYF